METIALTLGAFFTSIISAVVGMVGGMIFLAICLIFLPIEQAIPIHAAVQLVSNSSRWILFFKDIQWRLWFYFFFPAIFGILLGTHLFQAIDKDLLRQGIAIFILITLFLPKSQQGKAWHKESFCLAGFLAGTLGMLAGAIGPAIAPFFLHSRISKEKLIATQALCQASIHFMKIIAFETIGFSFQAHTALIVICSLAVIVGTHTGKRILKKVSEEKFIFLYKTALFVVALKLAFFPD